MNKAMLIVYSAVLIGVVALPSRADTEIVDGISWTFTVSGGKASVGGEGFAGQAVPTDTAGAIEVPSMLGDCPVTSIGDNAFSCCARLTSVKIPEGVKSIGENGFYYCEGLTNVTMPSSLTSIGANAFFRCSGLDGIELPEGLTNIENGAFTECGNLTSIAIPSHVANLGQLFLGCTNLTSLTISEGVTSIGTVAFSGCTRLTSLTIPSTVTSVGYGAFKDCTVLSKLIINSVPFAGATASSLFALPNCAVYFPEESKSDWFATLKKNGITSNSTTVEIVSSAMRNNDATVMDVVYKPFRRFNVTGSDSDVKVRALAFQDGERSFWKVVRATEFVNDPDGNPTAQNIGDNIQANVEHKLAWKVSKDWKTDLAKVKFEVLCSDQAQLPLKLNHIKAVGKYPALTIGVGTQTDIDIFNALLWHYADGAEDIINTDGYLDLDHPYPNQVDTTNIRIVNRTTIANRMEALRYIYEKMGYEPLEGGNLLSYARQATRKDLWFNSGAQNAVVLKSSKPEQLYVGEKAYCIIDVSDGPTAASYPVSYLDTEPVEGWGDEYKKTKILLRRCEAGQFMMQNNKKVTLTRPFYMGVFTITQKQYMQVVGTNPTQASHQGDMRPVEVSWNAIRGDSAVHNWPTVKTVDPNTFVGMIQSKTGLYLDLPTEAQWEYACRAETSSYYVNGGGSDNDLKVLGRGWSDSSVPVGLYVCNLWGIYDVHGNVGQWCLDYCDGYNSDPAVDYFGSNFGSDRVLRGHYYYNENIGQFGMSRIFVRLSSSPSQCRYGSGYTVMHGLCTYFGFRLASTEAE